MPLTPATGPATVQGMTRLSLTTADPLTLKADALVVAAQQGADGPVALDERFAELVAAAGLGAADRILLGGDVARRTRYIAYGGLPGLAYLGERFVPRLVRAGGAELADRVLQANPARWLTLRRSG